MSRNRFGGILAVALLAVAAPLLVLALLHALDGETQAAPAPHRSSRPSLKAIPCGPPAA